jgi:uncharacterized membrane protein YgdD (TMEM256/DUF423 family)
MDRFFFVTACLFGFLGVALGAFAAHGLKTQLDANLLVTFETGVRYQMYHAFALIAVAMAYAKWPTKGLIISGWMFIVGIILFSGSLYVLSLSGIRSLGMITPFGGLAFLAGWLCMAWSVFKK